MSASGDVLIYGATGYIGALIARGAQRAGLRPVLAGRSRAPLAALASALGLEARVASLDDAASLDTALRGVRALINTAGPFASTARPLVDACLRSGTHYLDLCGEIPAIEALRERGAEALARGVMLMPGVGFGVVASDCLAAHVARRLRAPVQLRLGVSGLQGMTRGSARTFAEQVGAGIQVRRNGRLVALEPLALWHDFDYGRGPRRSAALGWGDVASAFYTTAIPNIDVYFESSPALEAMLGVKRSLGWLLRTAPWQSMLRAQAQVLPPGPSDAERAAAHSVIVAEVSDRHGHSARARLRAPEAFTFAATTAPAIAERVCRGDLEPGFQTPARVFGADFVLHFEGVLREDL